jgi:hypothetical protein
VPLDHDLDLLVSESLAAVRAERVSATAGPDAE